FQAEDGIRDRNVTGVQTCALPIFCSLGAEEPQKLRAAVERALPLLEKSATTYTEHRECFACHHKAAAVLALAAARSHGFAIDAEIGRASCRERGEVWVVDVGVEKE